MTPHPHPRRRAPAMIMALAVGMLVLAGCGLQPSARVVDPVGPALSGSQRVERAPAPAIIAAPAPVASFEVQAENLAFVQQSVAVATPGRYRVRFVNNDDVAHEVVFDDGTRMAAAPGQSASAIVEIPAAGAAFLCVVPAHRAAGMVGQVTVTE